MTFESEVLMHIELPHLCLLGKFSEEALPVLALLWQESGVQAPYGYY